MASNSPSIPVGYRQTEIGAIPEDWELSFLLDIVEIANGQVDPRKYPYSDMILVAPEHVEKKSGRLLKKITATEMGAISGKYRVSKGDIIYGKINPHFAKAIFSDFDGLCSADMYPLKSKNLVDSKFVFYWILGEKFTRFATSVSARSGIPKINREGMGAALIAYPSSKKEQNAISEILSDSDYKIQSLHNLIMKKREIKLSTIQNLLSKSDSWQSKAIFEIASKKKWSMTGGPFGSSLQSRDYTDSGVRIIQLQNIGDGVFKDGDKIFTSELKADELLANNIFSGEIILSKMGDPVARGCLVPGINERFVMCSDGIRLSVNEEKFDTNFILIMINHHDFRKSAENASTGSTRKRIGLKELRTLKIKCPELYEQRKIASIIVNMDAEITALEKCLEKTILIKQGMMQQLLTGRIRLVDSSTLQEERV